MKRFSPWFRSSRTDEGRSAGEAWIGEEPDIGPDLPRKLELLVPRSWGPRQPNPTAGFVLDKRQVPSGGLKVFVAALPKHARRVAPPVRCSLHDPAY